MLNNKKLLIICVAMCLLCFLSGRAEANNITVANASIKGVNLTQGTAKVQFDISWNNSWRSAKNYDAAWVFVKYSTDAGVTWSAVTLKASNNTPGAVPTGFSAGTGTGLEIFVATDKKGAFLQRSANGSGTLNTTSIQFVWDYTTDGVSNTGTVRVKVFAIEMVYIPTGTFSLGSGGAETSAFYSYPTTTNPYQVSSEGTIAVGTGTGNLYYAAGSNGGDQSGPIPAPFPKGYTAFYMMKYEISQGQYADFLNTLTRTQQGIRVETNISTDAITNIYVMSNTATVTYRNTITCPASGNGTSSPIAFSVSRPDRACNYLSWADLTAYADWAGLRPMTELEFEKACRGTLSPVANEYAWGDATTPTAAQTISGTEDGTETITTSGANCNYSNWTFTGGDADHGPLRCGIFATASSTRASSGAGYYGNMELSGSLWERPVTIGNTTGRAFDGQNGDGALDASGIANVANWPGIDANGTGFRGGNWRGAVTITRASDRVSAANTVTIRDVNQGGRCVRTAP
jgi:formylglycine-generating enzyme required for sulfatase activity